MSVSHVSPSITEFHDFGTDNVSFNDILGTMHPDYIEFVTKTEASIANFYYKNIDRKKLLKYKINYNLRGKLKNGEYILSNHQWRGRRKKYSRESFYFERKNAEL
nr:hypothetical protein [uncultured Flavobacterium sp.]